MTSTLTYSNCPVPNALLVALGSGMLAEAGISLEILSGQSGQTHFTYDQPAYTRFGGEIPPLVSEGLRAPGRTRLLGISPLQPLQGFYVLRDSEIRTPADLKGRRIGLSEAAIHLLRHDSGDYRGLPAWNQTLRALGVWEERALLLTLEAGGLTLDDVQLVRIDNPWVDVPTEELEKAATLKGTDLFRDAARRQADILEGRHAETLFSWLPWAAELEQRFGARNIADLGPDIRTAHATVWTVSAALVEKKPDLVQKLADALVAAGHWASQHRDETIRLHAGNLGVSEPSVPRGFGEDFHSRLVPRLDDAALAVLEATASWLFDRRLIDRAVPLEQWAAPEFLAGALRRSEAATAS